MNPNPTTPMQSNPVNLSSQSNSRTGAIDCSNPQTQQEMNQCALQAYENTDRELQAMYQQMQGQISDTARSQLDVTQKQWVESRISQCQIEAKPNEGGSLYPTVLYRCMERMTRDRMKQLQEQAGQ